MNNENLKKGAKTQFKSGEQAASNGAKGGKVAQANRKRRKEIQQALQDLFDGTYQDNKTGKTLSGLDAVAATLFKIATDPKHKQVIQAQRLIYELTDMLKSPDEKKRLKMALKLQAKELELLQQKIDKENEWV